MKVKLYVRFSIHGIRRSGQSKSADFVTANQLQTGFLHSISGIGSKPPVLCGSEEDESYRIEGVSGRVFARVRVWAQLTADEPT